MRRRAMNPGPRGLWLLALVTFGQLASAYILSGHLTWERSGAVPHYLSPTIDPLTNAPCYNGPCGINTYDYKCNSQCGDLAAGISSTVQYPNPDFIRYVVTLVLDINLWSSGLGGFQTAILPEAGDDITPTLWGSEMIFCRDIAESNINGNCLTVPTFRVMFVDTPNSQVHVQWTVTYNYGSGILHTNTPPSVTAGFNISHTFNWPRCTTDGLTGNCFCFTSDCRTLTEAETGQEQWYLKTTVKFDTSTTPVTQNVAPATNFHAPRVYFPAVINVPFLENDENITVQLAGVDEDGTTSVTWTQENSAIATVDSNGLLTVLPMYYRPGGTLVSPEPTRNYHFKTRVRAVDSTTSLPDVDSYFQFWIRPCLRDLDTAKALKYTVQGLFTYQLADAVTAVFAEVGDARCVDHMLQTVMVNGSMPTDRSTCASFNGTWHSNWVTAPARTTSCDVNVPCNVTMTAVAFNFTKETSCIWSDWMGSGTLCADLIDRRAGITFDYAAVLATGEHALGGTEEDVNPARLTLAPFAGRAAYPNPYQFDIGRKEIFCVTALSNMSGPVGGRCNSIPHCLTVEVKGSIPKMLSPLAPDSCPMAPVPLVDTSQYLTGACPDVYLCWESETFSELAVLADDADTAETTNIQIDAASTFSQYSSDLVNVSDLAFLQATSSSYCRDRLQDPYAAFLQGAVSGIPPASLQSCHEGVLKVTIDLEYANNGLSPLYTQNTTGGHQYALFRDDKILCFTVSDNQARVWGRGVSNSFSRCHIIRLRGAPIFLQHPSLPLDTPFLATDSNGLGTGMQTLTARLLEDTTFTFRARDPNNEDPISIMFLQDPGVPNDASLGNQVCVDQGNIANIQGDGIPKTYEMCGNSICTTIPSPCAEAYRTFSWVPTPGDEGRNVRVCAIAKDDKSFCALSHYRRNPSCVWSGSTEACVNPAVVGASSRSTTSGYYGPEHCVNIYVTPPNPAWDIGTVPTEGNGTSKLAHVGCEIRWKVSATDANNYTMQVGLSDGYRLPMGGVLETISAGRTSHKDIVWTPVRGMEGSQYTVCVTAYSEITYTTQLTSVPEIANPIFLNGDTALPTRCVVINVRRCKYCANSGETLLVKMKEYSIDMNWLRLWAANGNDDGDELTNTVEDPGVLATGLLDGVENGQLLNIGPVYKLQAGESLVGVAARFRTTVKSLLDLNPDVTDVALLQPGQDLCLIPCSDF